MTTQRNVNCNKYLELRNDLFCRYCNNQYKNLNSLKQHEIRCKCNPDRLITVFSPEYIKDGKAIRPKIPSWNKGLTKKDYSERALLGIERTRKKLIGKFTGKASTPEKELERINKIKETAKRKHSMGGLREGSGRGKKGKYKGYYCDSTYELVYIIYNIDHNIQFNRCPRSLFYEYEYNGTIHKYYPDFILPDNSLIEIKGYHSEVVDLKISAVNDRKITVLYGDDLKYAFDYVKNTYNYSKLEDLYDKSQN